MLLLAAVPAQPDYVALAMVLVLALIVAVMAVRKRFAIKRAVHEESSAAPAAEIQEAELPKATAPGSAGHVKIHDVEPKTAAMIMAIVANKMDKPLNELRFISIKEVK